MLLNTNIKILVTDRNYSDWSFVDVQNDNQILDREQYPQLKAIDPIKERLFSRDIFTINIEGVIDVKHSYTKTCNGLAGLLVLEGNKTYGRTANKKRLLYKCIPDDKRLPVFLVPYDLKIGFSKVYTNKFVVFRYDNWNSSSEHPHGFITETIGDVDNLEVFYEYQLYCKSLHDSLTDFTNKTRKVLNEKSTEEYVEQILNHPNYQIEDKRDTYIFTIDPTNSTDFDDGFSIEQFDSGYKITVYIANVFFWMETLGLWNSFSKRVSTIYLPDRRRPMLPTVLSDTLCSLLEKQPRFALALEFIVDENGLIVKKDVPQSCKNVLISVNRNYRYEENALRRDPCYNLLFDCSARICKNIKNSHDVVSYWMVQMNKQIGEYMANQHIGIFRAAAFINTPVSTDYTIYENKLNEDVVRIIQTWNNTSGQYILFKEGLSLNHEIMSTQCYIHITSPIRRLVDLLNQMILFRHISPIHQTMSQDSIDFLKKWMEQMEYINTAMRSIRKIQTDCEVLNRCFTTPDIMEKEHEGVIFDKIVKNDGTIHYMVYLEKLKMLSRITTHVELANHAYHKFRIFLFEDEDKSKKKIRLQIA
uniref:RNB domain-containing protein n=1 Tax=viral metagenome TaxID=1070528 RepID=A0A6C0AT13_9ZZZZ